MTKTITSILIGIPIFLVLALFFTLPFEFVSLIDNDRLLASSYFRFNRDRLKDVFDEMEKDTMTSYMWTDLRDEQKAQVLTIPTAEFQPPIDEAHAATLEALETHGDEDHELSDDLKSAVGNLGIGRLWAEEQTHGWELVILDQLSCSPDLCTLKLLRVNTDQPMPDCVDYGEEQITFTRCYKEIHWPWYWVETKHYISALQTPLLAEPTPSP